MFKKSFWTIALILASGVGMLYAQRPRMQQVSIEQGLSSGFITCILQDRKGFIWIGTMDGLNRYDGHTIKTFRSSPHAPEGLAGNYIATLFEDRQGVLWVSTNAALARYVPEKELFVNVQYKSEAAKKAGLSAVYSMKEDAAGRFWLSSWNGGLFEMNRAKGTFRRYGPLHDSLYHSAFLNTSALHTDALRKHHFWVPFGVNGRWTLYSFNADDRSFTACDSEGLPYMGYVSDIFTDQDGLIWFITSEGFRPFDPVDRKFLSTDRFPPVFGKLAKMPVSSALADTLGRIWVGTRQEGVFVVHKKDGLLAHYKYENGNEESLSSNLITRILKGRTGEIWVGTQDKGLHRITFQEDHFRSLNPDSLLTQGRYAMSDLASAFLEDSKGRVWAGLTQGGLLWLDPVTNRLKTTDNVFPFLNFLKTSYIYALCETRDGRLWIGTNGQGLICADLSRQSVEQFKSKQGDSGSLSSDYVSCILESRAGDVWVGTFNGLHRYDRTGGRFQRIAHQPDNPSSLAGDMLFCMFEDAYGHIWTGTNNGLSLLKSKGGGFRNFLQTAQQKSSFGQIEVYSMLQDKGGLLWVATNAGLYRFAFPDPKNPMIGNPEIRLYTESDGLPSIALKSILEDEQGRLWISSQKDLIVFRNPQHDKTSPPDFKIYDESDGLQNNFYKAGSAYKTRAGYFLFGGRSNILLFRPDRIRDHRYLPPVVITTVEKFNSDQPEAPAVGEPGISDRAELVLSHTNNIFSIGFSALDFLGNATNRFAYRMRGFNNSWVQLGNQRKATFTNLDPGTYVFEVKGTNRDGIWNEAPASLTITIRPPWWKTWWAYCLYLLVITATLVALVRARLHYLRKRTRELEIAVNLGTAQILAQKDQLEQQAKELQDLDQLKSRFYTNITHELRTPLTMILGPLESLQKSRRLELKELDLLKMARQNGQKLGKLIQAILDLSKLEAGKLTLKEEAVAIAPLLRQMVAQFDSYANYLGVDLDFQSELDNGTIVLIDPQKFETIVNNLISNALKFTPAGGGVRVAIAETPTHLRLQVEDTGRGIHPEDLPHIFDRFYQSRRPEVPAEGGTGIGLALCAELTRLFRGRIWAESVLGKGSTFFMEWPKRMPQDVKIASYFSGLKPSASDVEAPVFHAENTPAPDRSETPKILLAEDNPDLQAYLGHLLAPSYDLAVAGNGEEALELLEGVDVVISDVLMPKMDGFQLLEYLKSDDRYRHIPVIMLTARADLQDKLRALRTGVDDYLTKPFDEEELLTRVRNLAQRRKSRLKAFADAETTMPVEPAISRADAEWLTELETWTREHLHDDGLSVGAMARHCTLSERQLLRRTRELTGLSPQQYIGELRLQRAREALELGTYRTVAEAAYAAGFSNAKAFSRAYRERFGRLPSSYF